MLRLFSQGQMMSVLHCNYWYGEAALEPDKKDTETWVEIVHILGENKVNKNLKGSRHFKPRLK